MMSDTLPHKQMGNGPVTLELATRVKSSITIDNFMQRMDKLKDLNEDEYRRTTDTTTFESKVIPIPHSGANNDVIDLYKVAVQVELQRQAS